MQTDDTAAATIRQFTDPMCTWCWGAEPVLRRLETVYGDQLRVEFVLGGLVEDFEEFYDAANDIATPADVGPHWEEAAEVHGMPVDTAIFEADPAQSTYPASEAVVAARQQDRERGNRFLRRVRAAYATQVRNVNRRDEQVAIAETVGLDIEAFVAALEDGSAREGFEADLARTREAGVRAFPTYHLEGPAGDVTLEGFRSAATLEAELAGVASGLETSSAPAIPAFVAEAGPVATQEVATVYELERPRARQTLESLREDGVLRRERRGTGFFWHSHPGGGS